VQFAIAGMGKETKERERDRKMEGHGERGRAFYQ
jgi:hypothetical protein